MLDIDEAVHRVMEGAAPLPHERRSLDRCLGRFLAEPSVARMDTPAFDGSAMDGYAVRAADLASASDDRPVGLRRLGVARAGCPAKTPLRAGDTTRIFTGAAMPEGADTVVMQEDVRVEGDTVLFRAPVEVGRHVRRRAEVQRRGERLADAGLLLCPGALGVFAAQGFDTLTVHRRPRVALLSTGDELRDIGEPDAYGTLIDSNRFVLEAAVREAGGDPWLLPRGADTVDALAAQVQRATAGADLLVSTGGVSVGEHDHVPAAWARAGVEDVFWKVRVKPGKPVRFGRAERSLVFGLPGNPVSAWVTFELLVRPVIRRMLGDGRPFRAAARVELTAPLRRPAGRVELARGRLEAGGQRFAPFPDQGSATLTSMVEADGLAILPPGPSPLPAGAAVRALDLRGPTSDRFTAEDAGAD